MLHSGPCQLLMESGLLNCPSVFTVCETHGETESALLSIAHRWWHRKHCVFWSCQSWAKGEFGEHGLRANKQLLHDSSVQLCDLLPSKICIWQREHFPYIQLMGTACFVKCSWEWVIDSRVLCTNPLLKNFHFICCFFTCVSVYFLKRASQTRVTLVLSYSACNWKPGCATCCFLYVS